jgi:hypothetical protein
VELNDVQKDFLERALWTAGQQFFAVLLITDPRSGFVDLPWKVALATALGAAIVSVLTTFLQYLPQMRKRVGQSFLVDLGLRLVKTFVSSFLATVGAMQFNVLTFDWSSALNLAAVATVTALGKGFLAAGPGAQNNPSTLQGASYEAAYPKAPHESKPPG